MKKLVALISTVLLVGSALAAPSKYNMDPAHTYPSFEADHMGGLSVWRGKIESNSGSIMLDRAAKAGSVDVSMDMNTINFGNAKLNTHAKSADMLDVAKFGTATYSGKFSKWNGDVPTEVTGTLTLHGVSKPVVLSVNQFLCKVNAVTKKEKCGADASGAINRADYGVGFGEQMGFKMDVKLLISVEAEKAE